MTVKILSMKMSCFSGRKENAMKKTKTKKYKITVADEFMGLRMSGIFESEEEAKDFYAFELDCFPEDIEILSKEEV